MNLLDVNVLVYSFRRDTDRHAEYRHWLLEQLKGNEPLAVSDQALAGFLRIVTHPRIFVQPSAPVVALRFANAIRRHRGVEIVHPGRGQWPLFHHLLTTTTAVDAPARRRLADRKYCSDEPPRFTWRVDPPSPAG